MSQQLAESLNAVAQHVVVLARGDNELKRHLRSLAESLCVALDEIVPNEKRTAVDDPVERAPENTIVEQIQIQYKPEPLPKLTLGSAPRLEDESVRLAGPESNDEADLTLIRTRCKLKAEGARWAASKQSGKESVEVDFRGLIEEAKQLPDCFLWMCHYSAPAPSNPDLYNQIAQCFEVVAEGAELAEKMESESGADPADFEAALHLLAEAQSALRAAIMAIDGPVDTDQAALFYWIREVATERQIFIQRYMRSDDLAAPSQAADILDRIHQLSQQVQQNEKQQKNIRRLLGKVRHKVSVIQSDPEKADQEWPLLIKTVCELIELGLPPSNRELRQLLLPVVDDLPESVDIPADFQRVLAEIDRFLAQQPASATPVKEKLSPDVAVVAKQLAGKSLVMIGGEKRQETARAIEQAFGLKELIWIETRPHESNDIFVPYVVRPDVAAVLLAIRWSSHSYGNVKQFCDEHGKPLVRLPGGYSPNQVAAQFLNQASGRLK